MESIVDNIARVLEAPTASDHVAARDCASDVAFSSQLLAQRAETLERKRAQDTAAKAANNARQRLAAHGGDHGIAKAARVMSNPECDSLIQQEMGTRKRTTRWHHLDKCFKWQAVLEHLQSCHPKASTDEAIVNELKGLLRSNQLDKMIRYDHVKGEVVEIRHALLLTSDGTAAGA